MHRCLSIFLLTVQGRSIGVPFEELYQVVLFRHLTFKIPNLFSYLKLFSSTLFFQSAGPLSSTQYQLMPRPLDFKPCAHCRKPMSVSDPVTVTPICTVSSAWVRVTLEICCVFKTRTKTWREECLLYILMEAAQRLESEPLWLLKGSASVKTS